MTCFYKTPEIFNTAIVRQKPVVYCGIVPREPLFDALGFHHGVCSPRLYVDLADYPLFRSEGGYIGQAQSCIAQAGRIARPPAARNWQVSKSWHGGRLHPGWPRSPSLVKLLECGAGPIHFPSTMLSSLEQEAAHDLRRHLSTVSAAERGRRTENGWRVPKSH
jgi:hypothetical protein